MRWQVIESGFLAPESIMAKDAALLAELDPKGPSLLHFYEWDAPCLTYGYFTDPAGYLDLEALQRYGVQKARRPTGGGIIFHLSDLAFSILVPAHHPCFSLNTLDNYAFINQKVAEAIISFTGSCLMPNLSADKCKECHPFCMAKPTQYDVMIQGKKVGGAAQRRTKQGLLHQASLSLLFPPVDLLQNVLKEQEMILKEMQEHSYCLLPASTSVQELPEVRSQLKDVLKTVLLDL
jgi:lipoate-protein ligase A